MARSYVCVLSFVGVRIDDILPLTFLFGQIEDPIFRRVVNEFFFFCTLTCGGDTNGVVDIDKKLIAKEKRLVNFWFQSYNNNSLLF